MSDDKVYVANSARAWGKDSDEYTAVANLAGHYRGDIPETVEISTAYVRGFNGMGNTGLSTYVDADEVIRETKFRIPGDLFEQLREHVGETELLTERCLVEAETETVEHDE